MPDIEFKCFQYRFDTSVKNITMASWLFAESKRIKVRICQIYNQFYFKFFDETRNFPDCQILCWFVKKMRGMDKASKWSVVSRHIGKMCEKAPKNLGFFGRKGDDTPFFSLAYKFECISVYVIRWQQVALKLVTSIVALR